MIEAFPAAGTVLAGRGMIPQLTVELRDRGVSAPAVVCDAPQRKAARKTARRMVSGFVDELPVCIGSAPRNADFLILVGGRGLAERFDGDRRPRALVVPSDGFLENLEGPMSDVLVLDSSLVSVNGPEARSFYRRFAARIGGEEAAMPGEQDVPRAFWFSTGTRTVSGEGSLEALPGLLEEAGTAHPLVLSDKGLGAAGLISRLESVLHGIDYRIFDDIPPDSDSRVVEDIVALYRREGRDGIVAFGGGSVLDTGKGVRLGASSGGRPLADWAGSNRIPRLDLPFLAVPTTAGTGSEVTKAAVIADAERGRKTLYISANLQPDIAVLDGTLAVGLPPYLTSITGMDALTHAVEAFTCLAKNPLSDHLAWGAVEMIRDSLVPLMDSPENTALRTRMAHAAFLAGQAFSNSMVGMVHTIGHSVGAVCHAAHGACMTVLLPWSLEFNLPLIEPLLAQLLPALIGPESAVGLSGAGAAEAFIKTVRELNTLLREKTGGRHPEKLRHLVDREGRALVERGHFERIARTALGDGSIIYNPKELRFGDVMEVLDKAY